MLKEYFYEKLPQWQLDIIKSYPEIYLIPNPKILEWYKNYPQNLETEYFCNLRYGFEFNEGWKELIVEFSKVTENLVKSLRISGIQKDVYIRSNIFKEKFGRLTWQGDDNLIHPYKEVWRGYLSFIEHKSENVCEITGKRGRIRTTRSGYVRCLCNEEYEKVKPNYPKLTPEELDNFALRQVGLI